MIQIVHMILHQRHYIAIVLLVYHVIEVLTSTVNTKQGHGSEEVNEGLVRWLVIRVTARKIATRKGKIYNWRTRSIPPPSPY